jgi:TfoX/Sxy family transcriptional regulator of competence genes
MASTPEFVEYVCEQIAGTGEIRHKKMFGDYMVYINGKPILLVCDNTVYVKQLACVAAEMENARTGVPYPGAKPHYLLDVDDADSMRKVVRILEPETPLPKPKKKRAMKRGGSGGRDV